MNIIKRWLINWLGIDTIKSELIKEWEESVLSHLENYSDDVIGIKMRVEKLEEEK